MKVWVHRFVFLLLGWAILAPSMASAELLLVTASGIYGTSSDTTDSARVCIGLTAGASCSADPSRLVTPDLTSSADWIVVRFDATTDPIHFPVFSQMASNGIADELKIVFQSPATDLIQAFDESQLFGAADRVDYIGFRLDAVELWLDPGFYVRPLAGRAGTEIGGGWSLNFYGTPIPEPTTALLLGLGMTGLAATRPRTHSEIHSR